MHPGNTIGDILIRRGIKKGPTMTHDEYREHCDQAKDDYEDEIAALERQAEEDNQ